MAMPSSGSSHAAEGLPSTGWTARTWSTSPNRSDWCRSPGVTTARRPSRSRFRIKAWDRVGLLKDVSTLLADERVNIVSVLTTTHDDRTVTLYATVEVEGIGQLSTILQKLEGVREVYEVRRETSAGAARSAAL